MKCDCKGLGDHEEWCSSHPIQQVKEKNKNLLADISDMQIEWIKREEKLKGEIERLEKALVAAKTEIDRIYQLNYENTKTYTELQRQAFIAMSTLDTIYNDKWANSQGMKYSDCTVGEVIAAAQKRIRGEE